MKSEKRGCKDKIHDIIVASSEIITNAYLHSKGGVHVTAAWMGEEFEIQVWDESEYKPKRVAPRNRGEGGGYGCEILDILCDDWGSRGRKAGAGKIVYARFNCLEFINCD
ncbi:ATP-binding protein (plasmid) [Streptomyces sp. JL4002]|uniref:ATP-binding protein n=1 Tax=Streptomyces sp. JL4002 TaxID=3404781 RepID=UPI003B284B8A